MAANISIQVHVFAHIQPVPIRIRSFCLPSRYWIQPDRPTRIIYRILVRNSDLNYLYSLYNYYVHYYIIEASAIITRDLIELKELTNKVNESKSHPPTYITLTRRVKMAHDFSELSKDKYRVCEKLVHEQHLQQQGWAAVVANLEDISVDLRQRLEICKIAYKDYMTDRDNYLDVLKQLVFNII